MTQRWWDPTGPAVDLLTPGSDKHLDTANALFALHRAGAAALNAAAATPLIDESVISKAADSARAAYAEPVCEALTAVLDDETYAGLLVRDIADAAENSALGVYRACVAKGVPAPIAAQRAALVYGVAPNHLGNYQTVAASPLSKDIAVVDAADRALFAWATTVSAQEHEQLSKRESPEQRRDAAADQPRADGGRWGRRNLASTVEQVRRTTAHAGQLSGEEQAEKQVLAPVVQAPAVREARQQRATRKSRTARQTRTTPTAAPAAARSRKVAARQMDPRTKTLVAANVERALETLPAARTARHGAVSLTTPRGTPTMPLLNGDTTYVMPYAEWRDLDRAARTEGKGPHEAGAFYITGEGLQQQASTGAFSGTEFHDQLVDDIADSFRFNRPHVEFPADVVMPVPAHVVDELAKADNPQQANFMLDDFRRRYLMDYLADNPYPGKISIAEEVGNITYIPDHYTGEMLFVWRPPNPDDPGGARPVPTIAEVTVDSRNARGEEDPGTRHGEGYVSLDPNTELRIDRSKAYAENATYDQDLGLTRVQIYASVADKFRKAESTEQRRAASASQPRLSGRWGQRAAEQAPAEEISVQDWVHSQVGTPRTQRTGRTTRQTRSARTAPTALVPVRTGTRTAAPRTAPRRELSPVTQLQLAVRHDLPGEDAAPFADNEVYVVLGQDDMERRLGVGSQAMVLGHDLNGNRTAWLRGQDGYTGDDALEEVNHRTFTDEVNAKLVFNKSYTATVAGEMRFLRDYQQAAGRCAVTRFTMQRYIEGDQLRIKVKAHDLTDHSEPGTNVLRWNSTSADRKHTLAFEGARRVLSPDQVNRILSLEWHAAAQGIHGNQVGGHISNAVLNWWTINDIEP